MRKSLAWTRTMRTGAALAAAAGIALAAPAAAQEIKVENAWVRAPVAGQKIAAAYLELTSTTKAALIAVESPLAARVEMHNMTMDGGVMRMRAVERIDLPAGKTVKLAPGGLHLMLIAIRRPVKEGERVPLTLAVSEGEKGKRQITVEADVRGGPGAKTHDRH
jgi:periplasmic copper chaperone A